VQDDPPVQAGSSRNSRAERSPEPVLPDVAIPQGLLEYASRRPEWATWLEALPRLVREVLDEWDLSYDGQARHGACALVVPVVTSDGVPAVAKFSWMHEEQEHEHLALQAWQGNGTVRMYRADPVRGVLLLERLDATRDLTTIDVIEACEITAGVYERIHLPALPQLRTLSSYIARWGADLTRLDRDAPIPRRLVEQAVSLGKDFVADPATDGHIIHGDLHYENVLAGDREPWLVIDPKPMSGDPHYEVAPLLWNRWEEVLASGDVRAAIRRRFHAVVDTAMLDEDRARDWVVVRMVHNAMWCVHDNPHGFDQDERAYLTMCIALAKAVQE
jgi:streptomycin 6-kinase